jgi:hypothetical protein
VRDRRRASHRGSLDRRRLGPPHAHLTLQRPPRLLRRRIRRSATANVTPGVSVTASGKSDHEVSGIRSPPVLPARV